MKAANEAVAGAAEFTVEALRSIIDSPTRAFGFSVTQVVGDGISKITTGKIISTNVYDAVEDVMERINPSTPNNNEVLQQGLPGIQMASLSSSPATLAMAPQLAAVQPQMMTNQPAPGYAPTYWTDRRAAELGMNPAQLAQRQGVGDLLAARDAREAQLMAEQQMA